MFSKLHFSDARNVPFLQTDLMKYLREDLQRRLLSTDFKKQVDGLEMLQKVLLLSHL